MQLQELKSLTSAILSLEGNAAILIEQYHCMSSLRFTVSGDLTRTNFSRRASVAEGHHQVDVSIPKVGWKLMGFNIPYDLGKKIWTFRLLGFYVLYCELFAEFDCSAAAICKPQDRLLTLM